MRFPIWHFLSKSRESAVKILGAYFELIPDWSRNGPGPFADHLRTIVGSIQNTLLEWTSRSRWHTPWCRVGFGYVRTRPFFESIVKLWLVAVLMTFGFHQNLRFFCFCKKPGSRNREHLMIFFTMVRSNYAHTSTIVESYCLSRIQNDHGFFERSVFSCPDPVLRNDPEMVRKWSRTISGSFQDWFRNLLF